MRTKRRELKELRQGRKSSGGCSEAEAGSSFAGQKQLADLSRLDACYELIKMIAGAGVGMTGGGAGMLRARRRDISIKPNRKLDRKSSRGMIYENEELRLRTIHINAEVEQGQNDIKKLRRENEQLRREIWNLRDEYDKLEEYMKQQKNREESDELEDRSENEAAGSDYSEYDEDEEDEDESDSGEESNEEHDQEERLENAENQKISSEKMSNGTSPIQHRTRINFDDLSVVDEEEEPKKDKKNSLPNEQSVRAEEPLEKQSSTIPMRRGNFPYHTTSFEQGEPLTTTSFGYQADCPFVFASMGEPGVAGHSNIAQKPAAAEGSCSRLMTAYSASPYSTSHQTLNPPSLDISSHNYSRQIPVVAAPPPGWQSNVIHAPITAASNFTTRTQSPIAVCSDSSKDSALKPPEELESGRPTKVIAPLTGVSSLAERRKAFLKQHSDNFRVSVPRDKGEHKLTSLSLDAAAAAAAAANKASENCEAAAAADESGSRLARSIDANCRETMECAVSDATSDNRQQPRHFFAPLKSRCNGDDGARHSESPACSEKTASTVVSRTRYNCEKGCADVYVSGAVPLNGHIESGDAKAFFSSENLLIVSDARNNGLAGNGSNAPLVKSASCQDLSSRSDSFGESGKLFNSENHAKSDNTLDATRASSKAYKSQLNVTLRKPASRKSMSSDTLDIPQLPSTGKLFNNPFLQSFEQAYQNFPVRTEGPSPARLIQNPLAIQVCESPVSATSYSSPVRVQPSFSSPSAVLDPDCGTCSRKDLERLRLMIPPSRLLDQNGDKQEYHVTSFENPNPQTMKIPPMTPFELEALRRMPTGTSPVQQSPRLYQNVPFVPMTPGSCCPGGQASRSYYDAVTKVPAQTQTSLEDGSNGNETRAASAAAESNQPADQQPKKRRSRKEKSGSMKEKRGSQRRRDTLKKQSSVRSSTREPPESPGTHSARSQLEEKNESRSSSSGQESPRKDQTKRVSLYLSTKKRPSVSSSRSRSMETSRERHLTRGEAAALDGNLTNSERERTNSISSREAAVREKTRKSSTSSGSVPWCACWGNGCI